MGVPLSGRSRVVVVGGGWAGCSAAAHLAAAGVSVVLLEASRELGGRARRLELEFGSECHVLDNGQHLMIGAYTEVAALLRLIGVPLDSVVERRPFELRYADGFRMQAAQLPAPWHLVWALLTARGLDLRERAAMAGLLRSLKRSHWRIDADCELAGWLEARGQGPRVVTRVWRPLAIAALNTPIERASAQMFANVLRDSLGAASEASELWLARANLSAILPDAAERFVQERGVVRRGARVERISRENGTFTLAIRSADDLEAVKADAVVYAAPPGQLRHAAAGLTRLAPVIERVERFSFEPIATVYLKYSDPRLTSARLPRHFTALVEDNEHQGYGQWAFDRGAFEPANRGVVSVVISASGKHIEEPIESLAAGVARQLTVQLGLPAPMAARGIIEKRATLAAVPGLVRPPNATGVPGFVLAGDWTESEYPSTLETAVRSGREAARLLLAGR
jgi:squalene-associated FAD-dependent desaturase